MLRRLFLQVLSSVPFIGATISKPCVRPFDGMEDIRIWGVDRVDEVTRREIYVSDIHTNFVEIHRRPF